MENLFEGNKSILKSMLLDEERLVTYVSLSKELCVHVNISKLLLSWLIKDIRQEKPDLQLNVNYLLCGAIENNYARTVICSEQDLSKQKDVFKCIFFQHIYSVCKGRPNIDATALLTVNKFEDYALCSGIIKSTCCEKRTSVEISYLKSNSQEIVVPEKSKSLPTKKEKQDSNTNKKDNIILKAISKENKSNSEPVIKEEHVSPIKEKLDISKPKAISSNGQKSQKGIAGFFNKSNNVNKKKEMINNVSNKLDVKEEKEKTEVNVEKIAVDVLPSHTNIKPLEKKDKSNKNLDQIKKNSKVDKKRKRVLHVSDSESDNENNDPFTDNTITEQEMSYTQESDDEIPPTPTTNNIKITSGIVNPKKKRKVVDKTYTDEDGYVLTKKEEIYESCSDNEENEVLEKPQLAKEIKTEVSPKAKAKKKVSPPQKGKQPTLTNFFKKI